MENDVPKTDCTFSYSLPDDVFADGEARPTKKKKKVKSKTAQPGEAVDKKRSVANAGLDVSRQHKKKAYNAATLFWRGRPRGCCKYMDADFSYLTGKPRPR